MTTGAKALTGVVLLSGAFLAGYVPKLLEANRLEARLETAENTLRVNSVTSHLTRAYLEAVQNNFGHAGEHASRFFTDARPLAADTSDEQLKSVLEKMLAQRDDVTAMAAKADPATATALGDMLRRLLDVQRDRRAP